MLFRSLSGAIPERLTFQSATVGLQLDDSAPTDFTYTYQSTGSNTFSLVVRFKADKWDEYDLTFTDGGHGSFVRREFDHQREQAAAQHGPQDRRARAHLLADVDLNVAFGAVGREDVAARRRCRPARAVRALPLARRRTPSVRSCLPG